MTPQKLRIVKQVATVRKNVEAFEQDLLKLMAHPEATAEQIQECRDKYLDIKDRLDDINEKLFKWGMKL